MTQRRLLGPMTASWWSSMEQQVGGWGLAGVGLRVKPWELIP
jgi:hypothetical protein